MDHPPGDGLPLSAMTWAALLARWTEFARASVAFPKDDRGERWRASVAPVIGLQATTFALGDIDALSPGERALGLDRAGVLVRTHAGDLHRVWAGEAMPDALREVVDDAASALSLARSRGVEHRVVVDRLEAPDLLDDLRSAISRGERIEFAMLPAPGTVLFRGEAAAFVRPGFEGLRVEGCEPFASPARQIYRAAGDDPHDVVALYEGGLHPGMPLLRVVIDAGQVVARFDDEDRARARSMARALGAAPVRVVEAATLDE